MLWGSQGLELGSCSLAAACPPPLTVDHPPGGCDRSARLRSPSQSPELTVWLCPSCPRTQASHLLLLSLGASASVQQSCAWRGGGPMKTCSLWLHHHQDHPAVSPPPSPSSTSPLTVDPWSQNSLCSWYSPLPSGIFHGTLVFTGTQDEKLEYQEFPGGPMVEIPGFHC